jgi:hypothetical protein
LYLELKDACSTKNEFEVGIHQGGGSGKSKGLQHWLEALGSVLIKITGPLLLLVEALPEADLHVDNQRVGYRNDDQREEGGKR